MSKKQFYSSPEIEVVKLQPQGVVCTSPAAAMSLGTPFANNEDEIPW